MINKYSYPLQFIILFVVVIAGLLIAQVFAMIIFLAGGGTLADMMSPGEEHINLLKITQICASIITFVLPAVVFSYLKRNHLTQYHSFKFPIGLGFLGLTILSVFVFFPAMTQSYLWNQAVELPSFLSGLEELLKSLEEQAATLTESFLQMDNIGDLLLNLFMVGVVAGFSEEILFRGTIQKFLGEWSGNHHLAIIVTGFFFSLFHMQFYGLLPRWLLGILFGYLFFWSKNIWLPIIAHTVFNSSQVLAYYFSQMGAIDVNVDEVETMPLIAVLISVVLTTIVMYLFYQRRVPFEHDELAYGK